MNCKTAPILQLKHVTVASVLPGWSNRDKGICACAKTSQHKGSFWYRKSCIVCMEKEQSLSEERRNLDLPLRLCVCACLSCVYMKGMTLTKRSSTFVKYYFPCEEPEGGGSSYNKWKLFVACLINKTGKLLGFGLCLLVGSQAFGNQQQIMLFSIIVLAFSIGIFSSKAGSARQELNENSSLSAVVAQKTWSCQTLCLMSVCLLIAHLCAATSIKLFIVWVLQRIRCHTSQPPFL